METREKSDSPQGTGKSCPRTRTRTPTWHPILQTCRRRVAWSRRAAHHNQQPNRAQPSISPFLFTGTESRREDEPSARETRFQPYLEIRGPTYRTTTIPEEITESAWGRKAERRGGEDGWGPGSSSPSLLLPCFPFLETNDSQTLQSYVSLEATTILCEGLGLCKGPTAGVSDEEGKEGREGRRGKERRPSPPLHSERERDAHPA